MTPTLFFRRMSMWLLYKFLLMNHKVVKVCPNNRLIHLIWWEISHLLMLLLGFMFKIWVILSQNSDWTGIIILSRGSCEETCEQFHVFRISWTTSSLMMVVVCRILLKCYGLLAHSLINMLVRFWTNYRIWSCLQFHLCLSHSWVSWIQAKDILRSCLCFSLVFIIGAQALLLALDFLRMNYFFFKSSCGTLQILDWSWSLQW